MQIISDVHKDSATPSKKPGSYEWWYFDAIDRSSGYAFVIIFYQGNPFSNRYINRLEQEDGGEGSEPDRFPAISISLYKDNKPVFYSFTEYSKDDTHFNTEEPLVKIGENTLEATITGEEIIYELNLLEELPSGDRISANLNFTGEKLEILKSGEEEFNDRDGHIWNLVQPKAIVNGSIAVFLESDKNHEIDFSGLGYHDHNLGLEPMKDEFKDWYWGRFHFPKATLVYYIMNRHKTQQHHGWLIDDAGREVIEKFEDIKLRDKGLSLFGLDSARKIILQNNSTKIVVQQSRYLDNGPFYQRFLSDAFLSQNGNGILRSKGFSEYIYPERIYWRLLWPLVDMRIRYKEENPHWVQKSARLYRWTW